MIPVLAGLPALLRLARPLLFGLVLLALAHGQFARLKSERTLERCRGRLAIAELRLERAAEAVKALRRESLRRAAEQTRRLNEAKRENAEQWPHVRALRRSADVTRAGPACPLSDALKAREGQL